MIAGVLLGAGWLAAVRSGTDGVFIAGSVLVWVSLAIGMFYGGRAAWESLKERQFDIDVLMVVGAALAAWVAARTPEGPQPPTEGALLLFLFVLAGALEDLAMARTTRAVEALHSLMPTAAFRWRGAEDGGRGKWEEVNPDVLAEGDLIKVLPGEAIPADARLLSGARAQETAAIDQATLTGESVPRVVAPGEEIYAGTINVGNAIEAEVIRPARQSSLQRVLNLVVEAQQQRQPVQRAIDRLSQPYAIGVMVVSALVFLVWWLVLGQPIWTGSGGALYTAITLLIVLSPCAVVISTPTATLAGITRGARGGVLFKGGQAIERLARLGAMAFDKTGTLTVGRPRLLRIVPLGPEGPIELDTDPILRVAGALEQESTHPIAAAIREAAASKGLDPRCAMRTSFTPGRGVSGSCEQHEARIGTFDHAAPLVDARVHPHIRTALAAAQEAGQIATVMAWRDYAAVFVLSDEPRPGAEHLVSELHALGVSPVVMLTGDNERTARAVATRLGIDLWRAQMLPEQKVEEIRRIKAELPPRVGMGIIGDGVNDAPALAAADVSLAIGSIGSDAALESADIVLLAEDLRAVPWAVRLARRARATIRLNLVFALTAIVVMAVLTLATSVTERPFPLWMGVLGHEGGTMLVVGNSLLLLIFRGANAAGSARRAKAPRDRAPMAARRAAAT